jgi:hypothetical protein
MTTTESYKEIAKITEYNDSKTSSMVSNEIQIRKRGFKCKSLTITILSNWGDPNHVGLCELELID